MSLADLPDVLIAHLTTYLDYSDVCNLMETSKKNYNAIKYYKKDKLRAHDVNYHCFNDRVKIFAFENHMNEWHRYDPQYNLRENTSENLSQLLNKCASPIASLSVFDLNDTFCNGVVGSSNKIDLIQTNNSLVTAMPNEFISLCEKVLKIDLTDPDIAQHLWTDEVFVKAIPTMYLFYADEHNNPMLSQLTDITLNALVKNNTCTFLIDRVFNRFTVEGIVKALEVMLKSEKKGVFWHLEVLFPNQRAAAKRYFDKDTGLLRNQYSIESGGDDDFDYYSVKVLREKPNVTGDYDPDARDHFVAFHVFHRY